MFKLNTLPKSPQIELSSDMFVERKFCQVFAYKSKTLHHRQPNGISHCEKEEQKTPKPPLPLVQCGPPSKAAMPRPTARTTTNRSSDG